jgi:non-ribosomal peptide synthase protein (TIGR01720 family)
LLKDVPPVYRTQINDILLAALTMGFASWGGQRSLVGDLEGHGREEIFQEVDLSRTVGWFTTISPVWLKLPPGRDLEVLLKSIKEQLRAVPERGLGFGALRDLDPSWDLSARLRALPPVEVAFNYLGQTDQILAEGALLQLTTEPCGRLSDSRGHRAHLLEINSGVTDGCLETVFTYSRNLHQPASIEALVAAWKEALRSILDHCQSQPAGGVTPSDFPLADFDQDELEDLLGEIDFG